jgi:hypothetical protein
MIFPGDPGDMEEPYSSSLNSNICKLIGKLGAQVENPETSGPAENLREEAAEMTNKDQDS